MKKFDNNLFLEDKDEYYKNFKNKKYIFSMKNEDKIKTIEANTVVFLIGGLPPNYKAPGIHVQILNLGNSVTHQPSAEMCEFINACSLPENHKEELIFIVMNPDYSLSVPLALTQAFERLSLYVGLSRTSFIVYSFVKIPQDKQLINCIEKQLALWGKYKNVAYINNNFTADVAGIFKNLCTINLTPETLVGEAIIFLLRLWNSKNLKSKTITESFKIFFKKLSNSYFAKIDGLKELLQPYIEGGYLDLSKIKALTKENKFKELEGFEQSSLFQTWESPPKFFNVNKETGAIEYSKATAFFFTPPLDDEGINGKNCTLQIKFKK